jgi:hypothetical protein
MSCFGDGKCMKLCNTNICFKPHEISKYKFCKTECKNKCELIMCKNWVHCKYAFPAYCCNNNMKFMKDGVCNHCRIFDITFLNEKRECFMCFDIKYMIVTECNHEMCFDCLFNLDPDNTICPFCASEIKVI